MASHEQDIRWRALTSVVRFVVILGLLLFLPAWTLDYWQGWVYLLLLTGMTTLTTVYFLKRDPKLIERRLRSGPTAEKESRQKIIQLFASVFVVLLFLVASLDRRFHWSHIPPFAVILADVFVILGFFIATLVFRENSYASSIIEVNDEQVVVSTGPYRFVRHPMYAGGLVMFFFTPIALGSLWGLLPATGLLITFVLRLLDEERFLRLHLSGYDAYCAATRARLVPFLW